MTESELKQLKQRLDIAEKLKEDLRKSKELTEFITNVKYSDCQCPTSNLKDNRFIGALIMKWISENESDYEAFLEFVQKHEQTVMEAFESA